MIFLADESLDRQIVDVLRSDDHVVLYVAEMDPGISDDAVLKEAEMESAILITADKDFDEIQNGFSVVSPDAIRIRRVS